jgi:hypothetical protein
MSSKEEVMRSSKAVLIAFPMTGMSSTVVGWTLSRSQKMWQREEEEVGCGGGGAEKEKDLHFFNVKR